MPTFMYRGVKVNCNQPLEHPDLNSSVHLAWNDLEQLRRFNNTDVKVLNRSQWKVGELNNTPFINLTLPPVKGKQLPMADRIDTNYPVLYEYIPALLDNDQRYGTVKGLLISTTKGFTPPFIYIPIDKNRKGVDYIEDDWYKYSAYKWPNYSEPYYDEDVKSKVADKLIKGKTNSFDRRVELFEMDNISHSTAEDAKAVFGVGGLLGWDYPGWIEINGTRVSDILQYEVTSALYCQDGNGNWVSETFVDGYQYVSGSKVCNAGTPTNYCFMHPVNRQYYHDWPDEICSPEGYIEGYLYDEGYEIISYKSNRGSKVIRINYPYPSYQSSSFTFEDKKKERFFLCGSNHASQSYDSGDCYLTWFAEGTDRKEEELLTSSFPISLVGEYEWTCIDAPIDRYFYPTDDGNEMSSVKVYYNSMTCLLKKTTFLTRDIFVKKAIEAGGTGMLEIDYPELDLR